MKKKEQAKPNEASDRGKYTISVAADLAGVHPQSLRDYEKKGLIDPHRTAGNTRLYSDTDLRAVSRVQDLIAAGVNLTGIELIVELQDKLEELQARCDDLEDEVRANRSRDPKRKSTTRVGSNDGSAIRGRR